MCKCRYHEQPEAVNGNMTGMREINGTNGRKGLVDDHEKEKEQTG